jgi:hypothetical protein
VARQTLVAVPYDLHSVDDLTALPPADYRVKGVLPQVGLAAIYGPSTSGKSFLAMELAFALSAGRDFFGNRAKSCDVVYVSLEGVAGLAQRVKAYMARYGSDAGKRIKFVTAPFYLLGVIDSDRLVKTVKAAGIGGGVIIVDTLNAATPGLEENKSGDMSLVIDAAKRIREDCGGLVVLIHHSGKDLSKGLRGHSSLYAALDAVIEVTREGGQRSWRLEKSKDGADGERHSFRLEVLDVGIDNDGDVITSCVVVRQEAAVDTVHRAKMPSGVNQRLIWEALGKLFRESPHLGKAGAPPSRPCIELEAAIEKVRDCLVTDPKRRTERTLTAIAGLIDRGLIDRDSGWIWCT